MSKSGSGFRRALSVALLLSVSLAGALWAGESSEKPTLMIGFNTVGYLPDAPKKASVAQPCSGFTVVRIKDGAKVFEGKATGPVLNEDSQEQLYTADFSAVKEEGEYCLDVPGVGRSAPFRIASDVFSQPFYTVTRAMYLWRCGTAVSGEHNGDTFAHDACHMDDAYLDYVDDSGGKQFGTKGWHDAGDYNKYVVNAGVTVGSMLRAWEDFGPRIQKIELDIPESNGATPDFLAEIKWELEWLLTMQASDGSVYHKLSTPRFGPMNLPERETEKRYFTPWSSAATADFVAMTAMAARSFQPYEPAFADRCLQAAKKSYDLLQANPEDHRANLQGFSTGAYQTRDSDDRLWAAAEFWETTGDVDALHDFESRAKTTPTLTGRRFGGWGRPMRRGVDTDWDWGNVKNLGLFTYLLSKREGREPELVKETRDSLLAAADGIVETGKAHGYGRPMGQRYYWGCNGGVARQTMVLQTAFRLSPKPEYRDTALDAINHLFGRNCFGQSFVTGLGFTPPMRPHDRRSAGDKVDAPWPGYLVGGANPRAGNWRDDQEDYQTNEIAINWNAALIYALAGFLDGSGS